MLELTKTIPDATKFHEMIRRYSSPTATTAASAVKTRTIGVRERTAIATDEHDHDAAGHQRGVA